MSVLTNLWSMSFFVGLVCGFLLNRAYCLLHTLWLNRYRPLPSGRRRSLLDSISVNPRAIAALIGISVAFWSVYQTQANANENARIAAETRVFAIAVKQCQEQLIGAIIGSREITTDNDRLSVMERDLLAETQRIGGEWVGGLLSPPADIARLDVNDPVRVQYNTGVTRWYFQRLGELNRAIDAVQDEQAANAQSRPALPDPDCGE